MAPGPLVFIWHCMFPSGCVFFLQHFSILLHARRLPLHFIFLTYEESVPLIRPLVEKYSRLVAKVRVEAEYFDSGWIADE